MPLHCTRERLRETPRHLVSRFLAGLEETLRPAGFARIHRSTIVNLDRMEEFRTVDGRDFTVVLESGQRLRLGRTYRSEVDERFAPPRTPIEWTTESSDVPARRDGLPAPRTGEPRAREAVCLPASRLRVSALLPRGDLHHAVGALLAVTVDGGRALVDVDPLDPVGR